MVFQKDKIKPKLAFIAWHQGGLKECLLTERPIQLKFALYLIKCGIYIFYSYDERIHSNRYILCNEFYPSCVGFPTWLNLYEDLQEHHKKNEVVPLWD